MELEYEEYKSDPVSHSAFLTKRMNRPKMETESSVTAWENLVAATCEIDETKLDSLCIPDSGSRVYSYLYVWTDVWIDYCV